MNENISILIDGSNFYFKLRDLGLGNLLKFNFEKFNDFLYDKELFKVHKKIFYIGRIRTDGTKALNRMHANQQRLFIHLKNAGYNYSLGYLLKSKAKYSEKGVDVNIATDMLVQSYEKQIIKVFNQFSFGYTNLHLL